MTYSESKYQEGTKWISTPNSCESRISVPLIAQDAPLLGIGPWCTMFYSLFQVYGHCDLTPVGRLMTRWYSLLWARQGKDRSGAALLTG